jgi:hypothetical protein
MAASKLTLSFGAARGISHDPVKVLIWSHIPPLRVHARQLSACATGADSIRSRPPRITVPVTAVTTCVFMESPASNHARVHYGIAAGLRSADISISGSGQGERQ